MTLETEEFLTKAIVEFYKNEIDNAFKNNPNVERSQENYKTVIELKMKSLELRIKGGSNREMTADEAVKIIEAHKALQEDAQKMLVEGDSDV